VIDERQRAHNGLMPAGIMCPADPFGCRLSTVGLPMFPSEITPSEGRVGLAVGETVFWLYVGSVEEVDDAGALDPVAVEGVGDAGTVDPFDPGAPLVPPPPVVTDPPRVLSPPVATDPPLAADPAEVCPPLPQPRGARHTRSATTRSCHCRNLSMLAPNNTPLW
jgi:hypothetical protein